MRQGPLSCSIKQYCMLWGRVPYHREASRGAAAQPPAADLLPVENLPNVCLRLVDPVPATGRLDRRVMQQVLG